MGKAVVFFSLDGSCARAASALAEKIGAKRVELKETRLRRLPMGFMLAGFQAAVGIRTRLIGNPVGEVQGCEELHVITPIWAGNAVPAINSFVSSCDFEGKKVYIYTVQVDPALNAAKAWAKLTKAVQMQGGDVMATRGLLGGSPMKGPKEGIDGEICAMQP